MTVRPLPVTIDVLKLVDRGQELSGTLPLRQMTRLLENLVDDQGDVSVVLIFGRDQGRRRVVTGRIQATVQLTCQRCLRAMPYHIDAEVALGVCRSEDEVAVLSEAYDPLLLTESPQRLSELVEDELILALPTLARHESAPDCRPVSVTFGEAASLPDDSAPEKPNPFAVLDVLKKRDDS